MRRSSMPFLESPLALPQLAAAALALVFAAVLPAQRPAQVYTGARILPGGAPPIENGVLVTAGGKIVAVGDASLALPEGADVVDCRGRTITPGLIDASFDGGVARADRNEQGEEVTPHLRVLDALDPEDPALLRARAAGVTAVHLMPGTDNVIGGLGCVVKTAASDPTAMLLKADASLRIVMGSEPSRGNRAIRGGRVESIYYRRPTTRMGVVWEARSAFFDAQQALEQTLGAAPTPPNPGREVLARVLRGELTAYTTARSEQDIRTALRIAAEFGYRTVVDEAQDAWLVVDELAAANVTVLLGAPSADSVGGGGARDGADPRYATAKLLADRGVPFVITTGTNARGLELVREAMFAARYGVPPQQALDAITIAPARVLGVADRVGSLAPGKDADFVVWSHDPLDPAAVAVSVHVDGKPDTAHR